MSFSLPELSYSYKSLEPHMDEQTVIVHHTKHHQTYINNLNAALSQTKALQGASLVEILKTVDEHEIPEPIKTKIRNNAGGHYNHSLFWQCMNPKSSSKDVLVSLQTKIDADFSTFEKMKEEFTQKAIDVFGSGWCWLCYNSQTKRLCITTTQNQNIPEKHLFPFLTLDVWEHAYYLKFQNRRADYIKMWWNIVDWKNVSLFYDEFASQERPINIADNGEVDLIIKN